MVTRTTLLKNELTDLMWWGSDIGFASGGVSDVNLCCVEIKIAENGHGTLVVSGSNVIIFCYI